MRQNRVFRRADVSLSVRYKTPEKEGKASTIDLSGGGALLLLDEKLPIGTAVNLEIDIPEQPDPVRAGAKVVNLEEVAGSEEVSEKRFKTGIKFVNVDIDDRRRVIRYVYQCCRERRRRRRKSPP